MAKDLYSRELGKVHQHNIIYNLYINFILQCTWTYSQIHDLNSPLMIRRKIQGININ